jgi:chromate transporter
MTEAASGPAALLSRVRDRASYLAIPPWSPWQPSEANASRSSIRVGRDKPPPGSESKSAPAVLAQPLPVSAVGWRALALAYLKIGGISIGGRSASYLMDELVERRRWLKREDWMEGLMLGWILPGPIGASVAMFLATRLRGPLAGIPAVALYSVPGIAIALVLSVLLFGGHRPSWVNGGIYALSACAFGLFMYTSLRTVPDSRKTRLGPVLLVLAFVLHGLLAVDLFVVLLGLGGISVVLNRPAAKAGEGVR